MSLPRSWDTIVRDHRHLIFEQDLRPVLELRWEQAGDGRYRDNQNQKIIARLQKEADRSVLSADTPRFLTGLTGSYHIRCLQRPSSSTSECALLSCKNCGTPILLKFYPDYHRQAANAPNIISGLSCCSKEGSDDWWSIHDIRFRMPDGYALTSYAFRFGLSRLCFAHKTARITLCRLAPASQHLQNSSLQELFASFSGSEPGQQEIIDDGTLQYASVPGFGKRLFPRLRRKKPFVFARFNHHAEQDRITGFLLESARPIQLDTLQTIQDSYGIIQQETPENHIHP